MTELKRRYYLDVLAIHSSQMYASLIYPSDIISENLKEIVFDNRKDYEPFRGYFARKDRKLFWIDEKLINELPLKVRDVIEELVCKDDVATRPMNPQRFKLVPELKISVRELIDDLAPYDHSVPKQWTLMKIVALMGFIGRVYVCISSKSHFGKSALYELLHYLTDKCPVFKPRSVPGVLNHITGNGNIVLDETHKCKSEVRDIIEEFALQIGGGKSLYLNGALKSKNTKSKYDAVLQSITFLFNNVDQYKNPDTDYFEFIFSNNKAIDDRFLKLKFDGILTERFKKDFDLQSVAKTNRMYYIDFAKSLLYLQQVKQQDKYGRRWSCSSVLDLKGRRKIVYDEISWLLDLYCENQDEFNCYIQELDGAIMAYREMVNKLDENYKSMTEYEEL